MQRKKRKAAKASAPKSSGWAGDAGESGESDSDSDDDGDSDDEEEEEEGEEVKDEKKEDAKDETSEAAAAASEAASRKAEKAAIRDARREERKARRATERAAAAAKAAKAAAKAAAGEDEAEDEEQGEGADEDVNMAGEDEDEAEDAGQLDDEAIPDLPETRRSPSPPPLEPFPLPRMAPAPSDAVLSRQGLPAGLANATFIEQSDRLAVSALADKLGAGSAGLSDRTQKRLVELGVSDFFAVQAAMLPHLLRLPLVPLPHAVLDDYLVSAPTGSGKTLAYAIPIVEVLARRVVPRLRALIVLPTRDLVVQVKETLEALSKGTGLLVS